MNDQAVREAADGFFAFIAKAILISTFGLMTLLWALYWIVDAQEKFDAPAEAPGRAILRVESTGIYKLKLENGTGPDCSLYSMGRRRALLFRPAKAWYGSVSGAETAYLSHIESPGVYSLECQGGPASLKFTKAPMENGLWLFAWLVALPVGVMGGFLLLGRFYIHWAMPKGGYKAYLTEDPEQIARIEQRNRRKE